MGEDFAPDNFSTSQLLSFRHTYTRQQLETYISTCIAPTPSYTLDTLEEEVRADPLSALGVLQTRQLAFNPWGNIAMHYSQHRTITLDPEALYHKIVERKLGGYCMENNTFFSTVLRSLGYQLYTTGARICQAISIPPNPKAFTGWSHQVILVIMDGKKYVVDVGFGSTTPIYPIPLEAEPDKVYQSVPGAELRLVRRNIAPNTASDQKLFVLESRVTGKDWQGCYCFDTLEWLPEDFDVVSFRVSQDRAFFFAFNLLLMKLLLDEETRTKVVGTLILNGGKFERRLGHDPKEVVFEASNEKERVEGMEKWFGINLREEEKRGILGTATAIIPKPSQ